MELHADDGYAILLNEKLYSDECGLEISSEGGEGFFALRCTRGMCIAHPRLALQSQSKFQPTDGSDCMILAFLWKGEMETRIAIYLRKKRE